MSSVPKHFLNPFLLFMESNLMDDVNSENNRHVTFIRKRNKGEDLDVENYSNTMHYLCTIFYGSGIMDI